MIEKISKMRGTVALLSHTWIPKDSWIPKVHLDTKRIRF